MKLSLTRKKTIVLVAATIVIISGVAVYAQFRPTDKIATVAPTSETKQGGRQTEKPKHSETEQKKAESEVKKKEEEKKKEAAKTDSTAKKPAPVAAPKSTPAPTPTPAPNPTAPIITPPSIRGRALYVDPSYAQAGRPAQLASQPIASWFGNWSGNIQTATNNLVSGAAAKGALAVMVAYNIPGRDCGNYSSGGAGGSAEYRTWIQSFARGIGNREAVVILEPDALAQITCLSSTDQATRYADLSFAVATLATQTRAFVYLDGGNSTWIAANTMSSRLKQANIAQARGFALNVSNFETSASSIAYGNQITAATGKPYVIDTSRNGNGANGEWCNPRGRALGTRPTTNTTGNLDAYLWVKRVGESDGACNGGPAAGTWWQEYAQELITNSGY